MTTTDPWRTVIFLPPAIPDDQPDHDQGDDDQ